MNKKNQNNLNQMGMKVLKEEEIISFMKNCKLLHLEKIWKNFMIKKFKLTYKICKTFQILMDIKDKS